MEITPVSVISAIEQGTITLAIIKAVSHARSEEFPELHRALEHYDPTAGVSRAFDLINAKLEIEYFQRNERPTEREMFTFMKLETRTRLIEKLGFAFVNADLPMQGAFVYMTLITLADCWLGQRDYKVHGWECEYYCWGTGLTRAVAKLNCKSHGWPLWCFQNHLTAVVSRQWNAYRDGLDDPLTECRRAVKQVLQGRKYTCPACREKYASGRFGRCDDACKQQLNPQQNNPAADGGSQSESSEGEEDAEESMESIGENSEEVD